MMEGVNLIKIYCKHICKGHSVSPYYNYYMQKKREPFIECLTWLYSDSTKLSPVRELF
jgi:hypothetical protein